MSFRSVGYERKYNNIIYLISADFTQFIIFDFRFLCQVYNMVRFIFLNYILANKIIIKKYYIETLSA